MREYRLIAVLILSAVLFAGHSAHADYNPSLGRWMEEDPIGNPSIRDVKLVSALKRDLKTPTNILENDEINKAIVRAARETAKELGLQHADDTQLWRYADGVNLYQDSGSNPVTRTDAAGEFSVEPILPVLDPIITVKDGWEISKEASNWAGAQNACTQCTGGYGSATNPPFFLERNYADYHRCALWRAWLVVS
jgi:hypothetical protein